MGVRLNGPARLFFFFFFGEYTWLITRLWASPRWEVGTDEAPRAIAVYFGLPIAASDLLSYRGLDTITKSRFLHCV